MLRELHVVILWVSLDSRPILGMRLHRRAHNRDVAPGKRDVLFEGRHWLWSDDVIFSSDRKFHRKTYPTTECGRWFIQGNVLKLNWDWWGAEELTTDDGGANFWKWDLSLSSAAPPAWWLESFKERAQNISDSNLLLDKIWANKGSLPEKEGVTMDSFPSVEFDGDLNTVEKCKRWCDAMPDCIGFSALVNSGIVESWWPKKSGTGFDPEAAVWKESNGTDGRAWEFHWKADEESLARNNDGSSLLVRCPNGLIQHPDYGYQCSNPGGSIAFNKDGTVNLEQLLLQHFAASWLALASKAEGKDWHGHNSLAPGALDFEEVWGDIRELVIPSNAHIVASGLLLASKATAGSGIGIGFLSHFLGKSILATLHVLHGPLLPVVLLVTYMYKLYTWWEATVSAQKKIGALVVKSACMQQYNYMDGRWSTVGATGELDEQGQLKTGLIQDICGTPIAAAMEKQVKRTLNAMREMFRAIEQIGWCMYHNGENGLNHTGATLSMDFGASCSSEILPVLRGHNGRAGVLSAALLLAASYAQQTDEFFDMGDAGNGIYNMLYNAFLKNDFPDFGLDVSAILSQLQASENEEKQLGCLSLVVTQQAYESLFSHMKESIPIWMRTFGVDDTENWYYNSGCMAIYNDMSEPSDHVCKRMDKVPEPWSYHECESIDEARLFGEE